MSDYLATALVVAAIIIAVAIFITLAIIAKLEQIRNEINDDDSGLL